MPFLECRDIFEPSDLIQYLKAWIHRLCNLEIARTIPGLNDYFKTSALKAE